LTLRIGKKYKKDQHFSGLDSDLTSIAQRQTANYLCPMKSIFVSFGLFLFAMVCGHAQSDYTETLNQWRKQRVESLKGEEGWLNLAGRFILSKGQSTFGSSTKNKIRFPKGKCAKYMGHFALENDTVWMQADKKVMVNGVIRRGRLPLYPAASPQIVQSGSLRWFVIRRGDQFVVRLRDLEHPSLRGFHGAEAYPADTTWRLKARLEPSEGKIISITNVLGQTSLQESPGTLVFDWKGQKCRLDPLVEGNQLFIIFSDETTGTETYGSGRFLYAALPDANGETTLDFNYAINPPCAFTAFATCPLPPPQNALPLSVKAGEKNYGEH
jgi:uncharacterized protein